jgi:hypothetical protein
LQNLVLEAESLYAKHMIGLVLSAVVVLALYAFVPNFHIPLVERLLLLSIGNWVSVRAIAADKLFPRVRGSREW